MENIKKKKSHVYRVGDKVQIMENDVFVRCGFPLTKADIRTDYEKMREVYNSIDEVCTKIFCDKNKPWYTDGIWDHKIRDIMEKQLVFGILKAKNFGGNERKIYTEKIGLNNLDVAEVISKKIVRTGVYEKGKIKGRNNVILNINKNGHTCWIEAKNVRILKKPELALM